MPGTAPPRPRRRWRRAFGLRALMTAVLVLGGGLGWIAYRARIQREAVAAIEQAGGHVKYDWELQELQGGQPVGPGAKPPWPKWLIDAIGLDCVSHVVAAWAMDYEGKIDRTFMGHLDRLDRLESVDLSGSIVNDASLAHLGGLGRLTHLDLTADASLTDAGLAHLRGLRRLEWLGIHGEGVKGPGLASLKGLVRLEGLVLDSISPSDDDLAYIAGLTSLRYLSLAGGQLTDRGLAHLRGMTHLKTLVLNGRSSQVSTAGLSHLAGLPIESLAIHDSWVKSLEPLRPLDGLMTLDISGVPVDNAGLAPIASFRGLRLLALNGTKVDSAGLAHVAGLENLERLHVDGGVLTDAALDYLIGLPKLDSLFLSGGPAFTQAGVAKLAKMPRLDTIVIDGVWAASSGIVDAMPAALPGVSIKAR